MKHFKLFIILSVLAVLVYTALCFNAVFALSDIQTEYSVYSNNDVEKAEEILSSYKRKNLLFLDTDEIAEKIVKETALKVDFIKKDFPGTLKVRLFARQERFALRSEDGYYILDDEYTVIDFRESAASFSDALSNVVLTFDVKDEVFAESKKPLAISNSALLDSLKTAVSCFESPRDAIEKINVFETEEKGNYRMEIFLRSGVKIEIYKAVENVLDKTKAGLNKYAEIEQADKLDGVISCYQTVSGAIIASYDPQ